MNVHIVAGTGQDEADRQAVRNGLVAYNRRFIPEQMMHFQEVSFFVKDEEGRCRMIAYPTSLQDVLILEPAVYGDSRGFFMESYNAETFRRLGVDIAFVQDNHSLSSEAGVVLGLHYQLEPHAQTKLVRVLSGAIYDVVVDIRRSSPSFGEWFGVILSESNKRQLLVPKGFAHGFCTLVANTQVLYKVDAYYAAQHDRGIQWNDPTLGIDWPVAQPILSDKDAQHPPLALADINFP